MLFAESIELLLASTSKNINNTYWFINTVNDISQFQICCDEISQMYIVCWKTESCCSNKISCMAITRSITHHHYKLFMIQEFFSTLKIGIFLPCTTVLKTESFIFSMLSKLKEQIWKCKYVNIFVFINCHLYIVSHCFGTHIIFKHDTFVHCQLD